MKKMTRSAFTRKELEQMNRVHPGAFAFEVRQVKNKMFVPVPQLVVSPVFMADVTMQQQMKCKMTGSVLIQRRHEFSTKLVDIVKTHHQRFLRGLSYKIHHMDLTSWHPDFQIEEVAEVPTLRLTRDVPEEPVVNVPISAKEILEKKQGRLTKQAIEGLERIAALQEKAKKHKQQQQHQQQQQQLQTAPKVNAAVNTPKKKKPASCLMGISNSLVEKIRQKERVSLKNKMTRTPAMQAELQQLKTYPRLARLLRTLFASEKKSCLKMELVSSKLLIQSKCHTAMSLEVLLRSLAKDSCSWLKVVTVSKVEYVKMDMNRQINDVVRLFEGKVRDFEKSN